MHTLVILALLTLSCIESFSVAPSHRHSRGFTTEKPRNAGSCRPLLALSIDNGDSRGIVSGGKFSFLGSGSQAIVRPGVVLVAPTHEYHHYYRRSAIFIYAMGESAEFAALEGNADYDETGEYVIRGVIIDHPTPFTLAEMTSGLRDDFVENPLGQKLLFRGGSQGGECVLLFHDCQDAAIGESIGSSGVYQGGWDKIISCCASGKLDPDYNAKVFFNYLEFTETELESMLHSTGKEDSSDLWISMEVPTDFILNPDYARGDAWSRLRNLMAGDYQQQIL
jgi:hypothetical protein